MVAAPGGKESKLPVTGKGWRRPTSPKDIACPQGQEVRARNAVSRTLNLLTTILPPSKTPFSLNAPAPKKAKLQ